MHLGLIVETDEPGTVWNGFRLALRALEEGHTVDAFLLGDGVEAPDLPAEHDVNPHGIIRKFDRDGGNLLACRTCMGHRDMEPDELRRPGDMGDLLAIIEEADETITIG